MTTLEVGSPAPAFNLPNADGELVSLSQLLAKAPKGVVVYFYPKAATPGCTKEACDFRDSSAAWAEAGYSVVGISPDKVEALKRFATKQELPFPLLSDADHQVMEAWREKKNYGRVSVGVRRSTFVISPDATVALAKYNVKATGHVERLRKELKVS